MPSCAALAVLVFALSVHAQNQMASRSVYPQRKTADEAVTSSTTLQDDDELQFYVPANGKYHYRFHVPVNLSGIVSGYKFQVVLPTGVSEVVQTEKVFNGIAATLVAVKVEASVTVLSGALASAGDHVLEIEGAVVNGSTADYMKLQFAQNTSDASAITVQEKRDAGCNETR